MLHFTNSQHSMKLNKSHSLNIHLHFMYWVATDVLLLRRHWHGLGKKSSNTSFGCEIFSFHSALYFLCNFIDIYHFLQSSLLSDIFDHSSLLFRSDNQDSTVARINFYLSLIESVLQHITSKSCILHRWALSLESEASHFSLNSYAVLACSTHFGQILFGKPSPGHIWATKNRTQHITSWWEGITKSS